MTGAEHYAEAERLIEQAARMTRDATPHMYAEACDGATQLLAAAQVHATLALAAVTAWMIPNPVESADPWQAVLR